MNYKITIVYIIILLIVWKILLITNIISLALFPTPVEFLQSIPNLFSTEKFLYDFISTFSKSLISFIFSIPIGVGLGYFIYYFKLTRKTNELFLDFIRSIPATALIPIFIILFGISEYTKIIIATFSSSLVICLSTILGLKSSNLTRYTITRIEQISYFKRLIYYNIPESLPQIFVGLRAGVSLSLVLIVVSEMFIGSKYGLGKVINDMRYSDSIPDVYVALFATGLIGYFFNHLLIRLEKKIFHWRGKF